MYDTMQKTGMSRHFYKKKKTCPATRKDIELTDEVKEYVLNNRLYTPQVVTPPAPVTINQTINNIQTMNNFIAGLDPLTKIKHLTEHRDIEVLDFESKVENQYKRDVKKLMNDSYRGNVMYDENQFIDMVSNITESKEVEDMSVVYDSKTDRMHFAVGGNDWEHKRPQQSITFLLETLVNYHLLYYEIYLIRKIHTESSFNRVQLKECLEKYYRFIACFGIKPNVHGKNDTQVLYNEDDERYNDRIQRGSIEDHRLVDEFHTLYLRILDSITEKDQREMTKEVLDIVKRNHKINIAELNKMILDVIRVDEGFRMKLVQ